MKQCKFYVEGIQGKQRPRASMIGGHAHIYTPSKTKDFEKRVAAAFREAGGEMIEKGIPVRISIVIFHKIPAGTSKKKWAEMLDHTKVPMKAPDVDNICKLVMDAGNGVFYQDDKQVVALVAYKYWAVEDGLQITVSDITR